MVVGCIRRPRARRAAGRPDRAQRGRPSAPTSGWSAATTSRSCRWSCTSPPRRSSPRSRRARSAESAGRSRPWRCVPLLFVVAVHAVVLPERHRRRPATSTTAADSSRSDRPRRGADVRRRPGVHRADGRRRLLPGADDDAVHRPPVDPDTDVERMLQHADYFAQQRYSSYFQPDITEADALALGDGGGVVEQPVDPLEAAPGHRRPASLASRRSLPERQLKRCRCVTAWRG